jgi:ribosomal protein L22
MTAEETPDAATPSADGPRSDEPVAAAESEETRGPSAEDAAPSAAAADNEPAAPEPDDPEAEAPPADEEPEPEADATDEEPEAEAADEEPEADAEAEAPKRRRRPSRRRSAEPAAAETDAEPEAPPTTPAPTRRRSQRDPSLPAPVVRAQAKYVRSSARKARLVCDHIRGKSVEEARAILAVTPRAIAEDWSKLLESAVANAEHNHELVGEDLYVKAVHADEGPTIKRFRPRAMGRATRIRKRTSHLTILLTPKD